jgi:hypothetical protein
LVPRLSDLWPVLLGPAAILLAYLSLEPGWEWLKIKHRHEWLALVLTPIALVLFSSTAYRTRDPLQLVATGFSATFLMREIHAYGTHNLTYVAVAACAIWAWLWRERLLEPLQRGSTRRWLYSSFLVYFLSQLMDRRGLRILPNEHAIHVAAEEMLENAGHVLWITTAVVTRRLLRGRSRPPSAS